MATNPKNELLGYWSRLYSDESGQQAYLHFTDDGRLQWGNENQWRICIIPHQYWLTDGHIETVCPPNPRKESTPYSIREDGTLVLSYDNRETKWARVERQEFFESKNVWNPGIPFERQIDYMSMLKLPPNSMLVKHAEHLSISPQILVNTDALWRLWDYSRAEFASFDLADFKYILDQGVLIDRDDNMDATLLCHLAADGRDAAIELMLDYDADMNHRDLTGYTPLDYAVWSNRAETVKFLKELGAKEGCELD